MLAEFLVVVALALGLAVLYECGVLCAGMWATSDTLEFALATLMELVTLVSIPVALRMFRFRPVRKALRSRGEMALRTYGAVRILLLGVPMFANALLYYLFMSTTFGYMGIILLLCMPFVFPSLGRCHYEVSTSCGEE